MAYCFNALSHHFPPWAHENHEILGHGNSPTGQASVITDCEAGVASNTSVYVTVHSSILVFVFVICSSNTYHFKTIKYNNCIIQFLHVSIYTATIFRGVKKEHVVFNGFML
jgi:hypothetical protein